MLNEVVRPPFVRFEMGERFWGGEMELSTFTESGARRFCRVRLDYTPRHHYTASDRTQVRPCGHFHIQTVFSLQFTGPQIVQPHFSLEGCVNTMPAALGSQR